MTRPDLFVFSFIVSLAIISVRCFRDGAPSALCTSMVPGHKFPAQSSPPPFRLYAESIQHPDMNHPCINVTLVSLLDSVPFRGFLLEARSPDMNGSTGNIIGSFHLTGLSNAKLLNCPGGMKNAVTHAINLPKTSEAFMWIPPANYDGQVIFRATVVQQFNTFWVGLESSPIVLDLVSIS